MGTGSYCYLLLREIPFSENGGGEKENRDVRE